MKQSLVVVATHFSNAGWEHSKLLDSRILWAPVCIPVWSQNTGTRPRTWTNEVTASSQNSTCSVSTKLAVWPSSLRPRTLNRVPARSELTRDMRHALTCLLLTYTVCMSTLPHMIGHTHRSVSTPYWRKYTARLRFLHMRNNDSIKHVLRCFLIRFIVQLHLPSLPLSLLIALHNPLRTHVHIPAKLLLWVALLLHGSKQCVVCPTAGRGVGKVEESRAKQLGNI